MSLLEQLGTDLELVLQMVEQWNQATAVASEALETSTATLAGHGRDLERVLGSCQHLMEAAARDVTELQRTAERTLGDVIHQADRLGRDASEGADRLATAQSAVTSAFESKASGAGLDDAALGIDTAQKKLGVELQTLEAGIRQKSGQTAAWVAGLADTGRKHRDRLVEAVQAVQGRFVGLEAVLEPRREESIPAGLNRAAEWVRDVHQNAVAARLEANEGVAAETLDRFVATAGRESGAARDGIQESLQQIETHLATHLPDRLHREGRRPIEERSAELAESGLHRTRQTIAAGVSATEVCGQLMPDLKAAGAALARGASA